MVKRKITWWFIFIPSTPHLIFISESSAWKHPFIFQILVDIISWKAAFITAGEMSDSPLFFWPFACASGLLGVCGERPVRPKDAAQLRLLSFPAPIHWRVYFPDALWALVRAGCVMDGKGFHCSLDQWQTCIVQPADKNGNSQTGKRKIAYSGEIILKSVQYCK